MFNANLIIFKFRTISRIVLVFLFLEFASSLSGQAQVDVTNVFFKLNKGVVMQLSGDLKVSNDVSFTNNGLIDIDSRYTSNIVFNTKESSLSQGLMRISGDVPVSITSIGDDSGLYNLLVRNNLKILSNLNIYNSLKLEACIIDATDDGACLSLKNDDVNSLFYLNSRIEGTFSRMLKEGESSYIFPVGDEDYNNDLYLNEVQFSQEVRVCFEPTYYNLNINGYSRLLDFKWKIDASDYNDRAFSVKFDVGNLVDEKSFNYCLIAYAAPNEHIYDYLKKGELSEYPYIYSAEKVGSGDYNLMTLVDNTYSKLKIVNAILVGGGNESKLIMVSPIGISFGKITVFNQIGDIMFTEDKFVPGDFNASTFPEGTYYIYMEYSFDDNSESFVLKEFLQILNK